jgi:hypothetical protein
LILPPPGPSFPSLAGAPGPPPWWL